MHNAITPHPKSEALKRARGQEWVKLLREVYADVAPVLAEEARQIIAEAGRLAPIDVAKMAVRHNLHFKHACEWLEEERVLPTGTYSRMRERGLKVRDAMDAARADLDAERCEDQQPESHA